MVEADASGQPGDPASRLTIPRRLLEMGLVARDAAGCPKLSREGKNALFRSRCADALRRADSQAPLEAHSGVEQWLINSRFLATPSGEMASLRVVTARGKGWLASLGEGSPSRGPAECLK